MNYIFVPGTCPKCENNTELEHKEDLSGVLYCRHCDFLLPLTKEELDSLHDK